MARHLFEYVVYDLDRQGIVDFRLMDDPIKLLTK
jgi:hypothetical protein